MAKPKKHKKRKPGGSGPSPEQQAQQALASLHETLAKLQTIDEAEAGPVWGDAQHALLKTKADRQNVMQLIASRDIQKVYATSSYSLMAIAGAAGPSIEMARLLRIQFDGRRDVKGDVPLGWRGQWHLRNASNGRRDRLGDRI